MTNLDEFYAEAIGKAVEPWQLNDYGSERSQKRRFRVAADALGIRSGDTVVDVGCGSGELRRYLWAEGIDVEYIGYDAVPAMVELAQRYGEKNVMLLDALEKGITMCEHVVCLGVLGVMEGTEEERMAKFSRLFSNLCDHAQVGVAVTVQMYREGLDKSGLRWYMEEDQVAQALMMLRRDHPDFGWQLRMDYHPHDAMFVGLFRSF
jgi:trans-aconitate methyltransferase